MIGKPEISPESAREHVTNAQSALTPLEVAREMGQAWIVAGAVLGTPTVTLLRHGPQSGEERELVVILDEARQRLNQLVERRAQRGAA